MQLSSLVMLAGVVAAGAVFSAERDKAGPGRYAHCAAYFQVVASCTANAAAASEARWRTATGYRAAALHLVRLQMRDQPGRTGAISHRVAVAELLGQLKYGCANLDELVLAENRQCQMLLDSEQAPQ
jgi:hypothetical protein